ncbi:MAG: putative major pilin subunit [Lentisphaerae bacterium ADurb.Bin242]|nr:MAG: putative major pilin subunit [Lentisphaerae bacterium ADurb.Bin242]
MKKYVESRVRKRMNFTLIELLIVISIIAILAAMLLPALNKARKKAQGVACQANLKQLSTAFMGYTVDSNDYMPPALLNRNGLDNFSGMYDSVNGAITWMASLYPYLGIRKTVYGMPPKYAKNSVYLCPSILRHNSTYQDYGYNALLFGCALNTDGNMYDWGSNKHLQKISRVNFASQSIMLADNWGNSTTERDSGYFLFDGVKTCYRHSRRANTAWADGHVSAAGPDLLYVAYSWINYLPYNQNNLATQWPTGAARGVYPYGFQPYD